MENEPGNSFLNRIHSNIKFRESNCLNQLRYSNEINDYNNKITDIINERNITTNINQNKNIKNNLKINLQKQIELVVNIIPIIKNNNKNIIINNSN